MRSRWSAAAALGKFGPSAAPHCRSVVEALKDEDACVRVMAATTLYEATKQAECAVPVLEQRSRAKDKYTRAAAAHGLGDIGPAAKAGTAAITEALEDKDWEVRIAAALALYRILGSEAKVAVPALVERVNSGGILLHRGPEGIEKARSRGCGQGPDAVKIGRRC